MASTATAITLVGLGNMGQALGHAFLKSGRRLTVWNRTSTRASVKKLVESGATFESDLSKAISASAITVFCVLEYKNIYQGLEAILDGNLLENKTILNLTNGTPQDARDADQWFKKHGAARYFDGGIMVTPQNVGTLVSIVLVSGEDEGSLNDTGVKDLVSSIGAPHYKGSDSGLAAGYDLALLAGMFGMFIGTLTALALTQRQLERTDKTEIDKAGVGLRDVVTGYFNPLLMALVPHNELIAKAIDEKDQDNNHGNPMEMMRVAIHNILRGCEEEGVDGESLRHLAKLMDKVVELHGPDTGLAWVHSLLLK